ncbi:Mitochondrial inner membrane protein [Trichinella pseudospiralis]|uniref:MICOS complex subunit MIC60 n=2 Tax=Trichinella pseudospiralis TaxID=6337 RepID=A0A0V1F1S9_TRIPS|nr:Mitochondrial inner membrane protein [Trichinella pseudospiralis]KRX95513.1 Mitochondrial inner membrane protein [Trichinella pseudospiralis]KRY79739.1 Mitochondrial inner membrane protein [Trichinella pseudospiralis]KRY79740.1 Mitochondrial inner membrane protein [Trichinella pseudospiralis]KRY88118.1 Mitochondrial inner membrane protein [Trichinella pseudospiralis]
MFGSRIINWNNVLNVGPFAIKKVFCHHSSVSKGDRKLWKALALIASGTTVGSVSFIGYALYDASLRQKLEKLHPQVSETFAFIENMLPSSIATMDLKSLKNISLKEPSKPKDIPIEEKVESQPSQKKVLVKASNAEKDNVSRTMEKQILSEVEHLEAVVRDAILAKKEVVAAAEHRSAVLKATMEDQKEFSNSLLPSFSRLENASQKDRDKDACARESINNVRRLLRDSKTSVDDAVLSKNKQRLSDLTSELDALQMEVDKVVTESKILSEYRRIVREGRARFQENLKMTFPNIHFGRDGNLNESELTALLACAFVRLDNLEKELHKAAQIEKERIELALERQGEELSQLFDDELQRMRNDLNELKDAEMKQKIAQQKRHYESELNKQLKLQMTVQDELSTKKLDTLRKTLEEKHEIELAQKLEEQKRADLDAENRRAKALWAACQQIKTDVEQGKPGSSMELRRKPLLHQINILKEKFHHDPFVMQMLQSFPDVSVHSGVYTEGDLIQRFKKVARLCRRSALMTDSDGNLFHRIISFVQSIFIFDTEEMVNQEDTVDLSKLNVFKVVSQVKYCLNRHDLATAVKLMTLLQGEPAVIASSWIEDVVRYLETKQIIDLLTAHAAAMTMRTIY